jgi:hypothetical protein
MHRRLIAIALAATAVRNHEHELRTVEAERHLIVVDVDDCVAGDLATDLGEHVGGAGAIEQQRLMALRHDANDAQRDLGSRRLGRRPGFRTIIALGSQQRSEQGQRKHTGEHTHQAQMLQSAILAAPPDFRRQLVETTAACRDL